METSELTLLLHWSYSGTVCAAGGVAVARFPDVDVQLFKWNAFVFARRGAVDLPEGWNPSGEEG